ncbi:MAG: hypothetical protein PHV32_12290 [Eubacteriales bacterium]|nr:hypothetical protein [Eubacteriales bacterium]MDD4495096.1 hypothetical protein [Eubacteriales bacterium]
MSTVFSDNLNSIEVSHKTDLSFQDSTVTQESTQNDLSVYSCATSSDENNSSNELDLKYIFEDFYERYKTYGEIQMLQLDSIELNEAVIDDYDYYCIVNDERFTSIEDICDFVKTVFSEERAEEVYDLLFTDKSGPGVHLPPLYVEKNGVLYMAKDEVNGYRIEKWDLENLFIELKEDNSIYVKIPSYIGDKLTGSFIYISMINNGNDWVIKELSPIELK